MEVCGEFEHKTVLITGATGLIGYNFVKLLISNTDTCIVLACGRNAERLSETFSEFQFEERLKLIEHDITQASFTDKQINLLDYIFHAAGPQEREIVINNPLEVIQANFDGLTNCLKYLVGQEKRTGHAGRAIIFSSLTIYGNPSYDELLTVMESDSDRTASLSDVTSSYSESKRMSEVLASAYQKMFGVDFVVCRLSTIFGYSKNPSNTAFFEFLGLAQNGKNIQVGQKHGPKRDNLYVKDAVAGLLYGAAFGASGEVYNISSNGDKDNLISVGQIAVLIAELANKHIHLSNKVKVTYSDESYHPPKGMMLDNTKLKSLNWTINYSFREAIIDLFNQNRSK